MANSILQHIQSYNIHPKKSLGQNFLIDPDIIDRIIYFAGDIQKHRVLEIGPGPGTLTKAMLEQGVGKITAVETDAGCLEILHNLQGGYPNLLEIIHTDALKFNEADIAPLKIIANLPYNIGTLLIIKWLQNISLFSRITVMLQKEVASRLIALPKTKQYGRLSVMTGWLCTVEKHFDIAPDAFYPSPKVTSSVISLTPRDASLYDCNFTKLELICKHAFSQRRKILRHGLKSLFEKPEAVLEQLGIDHKTRAEELDIKQFCQLANLIP